MSDASKAVSCAIQIARMRGLVEIGPDEMLLGCIFALSRFGVAQFGTWTIDLAKFGLDWTAEPPRVGGAKVAYSDATVAIFDHAALIARADGCTDIRIEHFLVAFADEETGLMAELRRDFAIDSTLWRTAAANLANLASESPKSAGHARDSHEYLTPEEAAEALGIHVQTLRTYVRTGKLPALRLAGERALRIRRSDLEKVLEPLVPDKQ